MPTVPLHLRHKIEHKDRYRCAYCLTSQRISGAQMHMEHIIPLAKGGKSTEDNLCLSCAWCNSFKGAKTAAVDPLTQEQAPLFHPRHQRWEEHFFWSEDGSQILGSTAIGRATIPALQMNNEFIVPSRRLWKTAGWHPPQDK